MKAELNDKQKKKVKEYFEKLYPSYRESGEFEEDEKDILYRISYFQKKFREKVDGLSEIDFEEILSNTWAFRRFRGNIHYRAQEIIADNGMEKVREAFKILTDTSMSPHKRYGKVLGMIKGLGPATITEILAYLQPHECALWNRRAREALDILGIDMVDTSKYALSPKEYKIYNELVKSIHKQLDEPEGEKIGLFFAHVFFFELSQMEQEPDTSSIEDFDDLTIQNVRGHRRVFAFDHDEIRDLTRDIGLMLGFEANTEVQVAHGARVDVVWSARIGNLGIVNYVFEIHKKGSIDSLLMNLQKSKSNPTVQKVIAISDEEQLKRIERESKGLPEEFRRDLTFWSVEEVLKVAENLESAMKIIDSLNLTPEPFK
ncbi:hypothetical protein MTTB_p230 (plasmid) [Methanothermobacter tenebrarum]|uniref:Restriction endonuclease n=1 Tax=Methanothermobacter tenebrarum TaxID=680118 RepID=A0ABN6PFI2_9EURY|nr:hypothetical protein [Methanothermobacter tenebrarum]MBC7128981.1 hypothetical protein [Thermoplasmatales archaeon]BDH80243.1 hypothetical protein MTTB_p230 [Methanothermobacter tenebrarum]